MTAEDTLGRPHDEVQFGYRVDDSIVEVLTPGRPFRVKETKRGLRPRRAETVESLEVSVSPAP